MHLNNTIARKDSKLLGMTAFIYTIDFAKYAINFMQRQAKLLFSQNKFNFLIRNVITFFV